MTRGLAGIVYATRASAANLATAARHRHAAEDARRAGCVIEATRRDALASRAMARHATAYARAHAVRLPGDAP